MSWMTRISSLHQQLLFFFSLKTSCNKQFEATKDGHSLILVVLMKRWWRATSCVWRNFRGYLVEKKQARTHEKKKKRINDKYNNQKWRKSHSRMRHHQTLHEAIGWLSLSHSLSVSMCCSFNFISSRRDQSSSRKTRKEEKKKKMRVYPELQSNNPSAALKQKKTTSTHEAECNGQNRRDST